MIMRAAGTLAVLAALASPAFATGEILCMHPAGASIHLLVGQASSLYVDRVSVIVGDEAWTTHADMDPRGTRIAVGQTFADDATLLVDVVDEDRASTIARLRVLYASEGDMRAGGGVLQVAGRGAWAVDCAERE